MKVRVDEEKLAYGLEKGLSKSDAIARVIPGEYVLRQSVCALTAVAIKHYLTDQIETDLMVSHPRFTFKSDFKRHIVPLLQTGEDPVVIDASLTQFLDFVGLSWAYETHAQQGAFPPEKIACFELSQGEEVARWLTKQAVAFQKVNTHPKFMGVDMGRGPLVDAEEDTVFENYSMIWNPDNFSPWQPSEGTERAGKLTSKYIPDGAIEIN